VGAIALAIVVVIMGRMPWRGASRLDRRCGGDVTIWERRGWRCGCWQRSMKLMLRIEV
jgi:hypothetical protein